VSFKIQFLKTFLIIWTIELKIEFAKYIGSFLDYDGLIYDKLYSSHPTHG
jgi:hypothetical protein